MGRARIFYIAVVALCVPAAPSRAAPADNLQELYSQLGHCLASQGGGQGGEITLRFSLRRDGALLGKPHITYAKLPPDVDQQRRLIENIAAAVDRCLPTQITDALGAAVAGRPLVFRFVTKRRETDI